MSTPMFVREPQNRADYIDAGGSVSFMLAGHASASSPETYTGWIAQAVDEALLLEDLFYCVGPGQVGGGDTNTDAGELLLWIKRAAATDADERIPIASYPIAAPGSGKRASGRLSLNLTLGVGDTLYASHTIQKNGAAGYVALGLVATGGVVR